MAKNKKNAVNAADNTETTAGMTTAENAVTTETTTAENATPTKGKSIVPSKYAGKYKGGGSDDLANFINDQCKSSDGSFSFPTFFQLCRDNGIDDTKVAHYATQVAEKRHGAEGRARMTLRNMLATTARKNGKLVGLNGTEVEINLPKPAVSGAAAKAKAANEATGQAEAA